jgi:hypothetical protein
MEDVEDVVLPMVVEEDEDLPVVDAPALPMPDEEVEQEE